MEEKRDFRPKLHFTAPKNWLNDPNGLIRTGDTYHLFYQHNVKEPRWGPMHWGHAVSRDLYHWEHRDVALYPDKLGMIFSGSAVLDEENVSGLGCGGRTPLLAFFTYDDGKTEFQSMAFSLDEGQTFHKTGTPLIENRGIRPPAGGDRSRGRRVGVPGPVSPDWSGRGDPLGAGDQLADSAGEGWGAPSVLAGTV